MTLAADRFEIRIPIAEELLNEPGAMRYLRDEAMRAFRERGTVADDSLDMSIVAWRDANRMDLGGVYKLPEGFAVAQISAHVIPR